MKILSGQELLLERTYCSVCYTFGRVVFVWMFGIVEFKEGMIEM